MSKYEKPMVMVNEELAEGVYAASGTGNVRFVYQYTEADGTHIYRVYVDNTTGSTSDVQTITGNFGVDMNITEKEAGSATSSGSGSVELEYSRHMNSGDTNQDFGIIKYQGEKAADTVYGSWE